MARIIEVIVSPQGEAIVQTKGYAGAECVQASKWLEKSLGIVASDVKTPNYYQQSQIQQEIEQ